MATDSAKNDLDEAPKTSIPTLPLGNQSDLVLVMKGGGVKGLAYVGALELLTQQYQFTRFVGTSAGAIAAVLLGAGYTVSELKQILENKNFTDFLDAPFYKWPINLACFQGLHSGKAFTEWLDKLLAKKLSSPTRVKLSQLPHRVTVYASQRYSGALEFDPISNDTYAAHAVRCSMSIPLFFYPERDQGFRAYDGGVQHNYPLDQLLKKDPNAKFISLYLGPETYEPVKESLVIFDLISIATESYEPELLEKYPKQTVIIDPRPIGTFDFKLTDIEKQFLVSCGRVGALRHLNIKDDRYLGERYHYDDLKAQVEDERSIQKERRRRRRTTKWDVIVFLMLAVPLVWALGLLPTRDPVTFKEFAAQYEATGRKGTNFESFQRQYLDKIVTWDVEIRDVYPRASDSSYWIEPIDMKPPADSNNMMTDRFDAVFAEGFNAQLTPGSQKRIQGQVKLIGPSSVMLNECKFLP